jgi:hypothetical protein
MLNLLGFLVKDLLEESFLNLLVLLLLEEENLLHRQIHPVHHNLIHRHHLD